MNGLRKCVTAFKYSCTTCKRNKLAVMAEIAIIATMSLSIPLLQNFFASFIASSIEATIDISSFFLLVLVWIAGLLAMKITVHISSYYLSRKSQNLRLLFMEKIHQIRMTIPYELTLDPNYQKKLSIARSVMDKNTPCIVAIQNAVITSFLCIVSLLIYSSFIIKLHWAVFIFYICTYAIELTINFRYIKTIRDFREKLIPLRRKIAYLSGRSGDISAAKDVRIFQMTSWFTQKYMDMNSEKANVLNQQEDISHHNRIIAAAFSFVRNALSYVFLLWLFCGNKIALPEFVFLIGVISTFTFAIGKVQGSIQEIYNYSLEVNDYLEFEEWSIKPMSSEKKITLPEDIATIEFINVSYRYPGSSYEILSNINLAFQKGEKVGLVGLNGAGKTTLILLMCGLLKPTEGHIVLNGTNICQYDTTDYFSLFSAVFQDFTVLPDSVINNIGFQDEYTASEIDKINTIMSQLGLQNINPKDKFIKEIYDDAICLSGGEMQKISLARALYKKSQVLILDEPTASLDPLAEQQIYLNYSDYSKDKISIFISHRLASTSFCDKIIMVDRGTIIESGTHNQLMELHGEYWKMFEIQREYYKKKCLEEECM